jgi:hypothetical protein
LLDHLPSILDGWALWDAGSLWPCLGEEALYLTQTAFHPCEEEHHSLPFSQFSSLQSLSLLLAIREKEDKTRKSALPKLLSHIWIIFTLEI